MGKGIVIIDFTAPVGLKAALAAAIENDIAFVSAKEGCLQEVANEYKFTPLFKKDPHPYGWYRKFEKKRF